MTNPTHKFAFWRVLGASVGVVFGINDVVSGANAYLEGEQVYGELVIASGVLIVASSVAFIVAASNPVGWILIFLGIAASVIANIIRDDPIQKWLYRSMLGAIDDYTPYANYEEQSQDYKLLSNPS